MVEESGGVTFDPAAVREAVFQRAVALRRQGDLLGADRLCAQILKDDARHCNAHHLSGLVALDRGETELGVAALCRSLAINPNQAMVYSNLGNALLSLGQPERALVILDAALQLNPDLALAHYNRGNALKDLGRPQPALASYDAALRIGGGEPKALNNKGIVLRDLGQTSEALAAFAAASAIDPRFAAARENLTALLISLDRAPEALALYERALESEPDDADALCGRGTALLALGRVEAALDSFQRVLESRPESTIALGNAGNILLGMERVSAALTCFDRALAVAPEDSMALYGRGATLLALERVEAAAQSFGEVLRVFPEHAAALGSLFHLRMSQCDWADYDRLTAGLHEALHRTRRFVNPMSALAFDDPDLSLACARAYVARSFRPVLTDGVATDAAETQSMSVPGASPFTRPIRPQHAPIRVAYVSADFCDHPVSHLLVGVLERHQRRTFEVIGVSLRPRGEGVFERRICSAFDRYIDASALADGDAAQVLREAGVDIAVDLMGFTVNSRLGIFAHRPAAVQVSYLGYAGTLGAPYIDYLLADEVVVPPAMDACFDEHVVRLPHCFLPTDDRRPIGMAPTRHAAGLPPRGFVFCAFTKAHKITPALFAIWMRLLRAIPDSVLWLSDMSTQVQQNLGATAQNAGVRPERLIFAPRVVENAAHLARVTLADLYLDTQPYNAHSTTCDALWAGVPVLTCPGRGFASRVASSAVLAAGLPELVTGNLAEYERRGLEVAGQPEQLRALRARLTRRDPPCPLFDTARYTRDLEAAYRWMHERIT